MMKPVEDHIHIPLVDFLCCSWVASLHEMLPHIFNGQSLEDSESRKLYLKEEGKIHTARGGEQRNYGSLSTCITKQ
jgi:hypothetical protein